MSQILYRKVATAVPPSRNLVSSFGHGILESMPRVTRSSPTPTPPAEAVPTLGTASVSASPLAMPDPNLSRALAFYVEPRTPLEDLPCFTPGPLGAGVVLDLSRVFLETGSSCAVGSRHKNACALGWVATRVPPRPGAESWPMALEAADKKVTTVRVGASRAYREVEATRILVYHVLDLLLSRHLLLPSELCVMLHGASERGVSAVSYTHLTLPTKA